MNSEEAIDVLLEYRALLVHCAGSAKMLGSATTNSYGYLERLQVAAAGGLELACSTVRPRDSWHNGNLTGQCGLVLRPRGSDAITYAWPRDAGSSVGEDGRRIQVCEDARTLPLGVAVCDRSPDTYNEIGVLGYEAVGVFITESEISYAIPDCQVGPRLERLGGISPDHPDYIRAFEDVVTVQQVRAAFVGLPVYFLQQGQLHRWNEGTLHDPVQVPLEEIYGRGR